MSWAEDRRADRVAKAEQDRKDLDARAERRIRERDAIAEQARRDEAMRGDQDAVDRAQRSATRAARWAAARAWAGEHTVDLVIYPLAVASAVMAVPSMADYGKGLYGNGTGAVLPVLSELGMWAFAFAVTLSRRLHPDRPVWALQLGIVVFAASGFGINLAHGLDKNVSAGVVMGFASIAGVVAHQLVTASPRRSRGDRVEARIARRAERKTARIRVAAVRAAVAEIDAAGTVDLVYLPGQYRIDRRGRLTDVAEGLGDDVEAWLAEQDHPPIDSESDGPDRGPIATLDHPVDQQKSTPDPRTRRELMSRSIEELRVELKDAIEADPDSIDTTSAESIREALRCSPKRARQLREEFRSAE